MLLVLGEEIDLAGDLRVQLPPANLLAGHGLASRGGQDRRPGHGHDRALHLDDDVRDGRLPRRAAVTLAEDGRDERHLAIPRRPVDRVDHAHHARGAHDVGDARAAAVAERDHGEALARRVGRRVVVLLDADAAPRPREHGRVFAGHVDRAAVELPEAAHLAVGRRLLARLGQVAVRQEPHLAERAAVDEELDAFAHRQPAGRVHLRDLGRAAHGRRLLAARGEIFDAMGVGGALGRVGHGPGFIAPPGLPGERQVARSSVLGTPRYHDRAPALPSAGAARRCERRARAVAGAIHARLTHGTAGRGGRCDHAHVGRVAATGRADCHAVRGRDPAVSGVGGAPLAGRAAAVAAFAFRSRVAHALA